MLDFISNLLALSNSYRILSCGLPRSLCPSLFNKIPIMAHLVADKGFTAVANFLAIGGSIAIDERLYIVCAKIEVKLYAV